MYIRTTGDTAAESKVGQVIYSISGPTEDRFAKKDYGAGSPGIVVVLMCQDPALNLKRRVRFAKKDNKLYLDVKLDLDEMKAAKPAARRRIILARIHRDVAEVIARYRLPDFDSAKFLKDLQAWFQGACP